VGSSLYAVGRGQAGPRPDGAAERLMWCFKQSVGTALYTTTGRRYTGVVVLLRRVVGYRAKLVADDFSAAASSRVSRCTSSRGSAPPAAMGRGSVMASLHGEAACSLDGCKDMFARQLTLHALRLARVLRHGSDCVDPDELPWTSSAQIEIVATNCM